MRDLNQVRAFVAVVAHGGFRAAARQLGLSQPALSQQVRKLEAELGVVLLERGHARTVPSADGTRFLPHAQAMLKAAERATASLRRTSVTIAAASNIGIYILPPMIRVLAERYPTLSVGFVPGTNPQTVERLESGEAEIALMEWWDDRPGFAATVWRREGFSVICAPDHPWARRDAVEPAELAREPMIGGEPGTGTGRLLRSLFGDGAVAATRMQLGSTAAVKAAVRAGLGVSLVMDAAIGDELRADTLCAVRLAGPAVEKPLHLVTRRDLPSGSPPARVRADILGAMTRAA